MYDKVKIDKNNKNIKDKVIINKVIIRKAIVKKASINKTRINKATIANKTMVNRIGMSNKFKNIADIYNKHVDSEMQCDKCIKKEENTFI